MQKALVLNLVALILTGCTASVPSIDSTQSHSLETPSPTPYQIEGSILNLLSGDNKKCQWSTTIQENEVQGIVYTSD